MWCSCPSTYPAEVRQVFCNNLAILHFAEDYLQERCGWDCLPTLHKDLVALTSEVRDLLRTIALPGQVHQVLHIVHTVEILFRREML